MVVVKKLRANMRTGPEEKRFSDWLLQLGEGRLPVVDGMPSGTVQIPDECAFDGTVQELVEEVFGTRIEAADARELADRAILTPLNESCDEINNHVVQDRLTGEGRDYFGVDSAEVEDALEGDNYPTEFLNTLTPTGLPPHKLHLKVGAVVMLIRNLNGKLGLMNGTRMIVRHMHNHYLDVEVITGERAGERVLIPRIILTTSDPTMPFVLKRKQFPVRLAYAMTINKSQGQTLKRVGLYLPNCVFAHGQLYVAFSRVCSIGAIKVKVVDTARQGKRNDRDGTYTINVVYPEILG